MPPPLLDSSPNPLNNILSQIIDGHLSEQITLNYGYMNDPMTPLSNLF